MNLLLDMSLSPARPLRFAAARTIGSVLDGLFGYVIGYELTEIVGRRIIAFRHAEHH